MGEVQLLFYIEPKVPAEEQPEPVEQLVNEVNHELAKKRYYFHRQLDKEMFELNGSERYIRCKYESLKAIPKGQRYYVLQLLKLGYNIQYLLFDVPVKL